MAGAFHDYGLPVVCICKVGEDLEAVIEQRGDRPLDEAALRAHLQSRLEAHAIPRIMHVVERMPRTANDKLDRKAVAAWLAAGGKPDQMPDTPAVLQMDG